MYQEDIFLLCSALCGFFVFVFVFFFRKLKAGIEHFMKNS